jgi:hypothetical protein
MPVLSERAHTHCGTVPRSRSDASGLRRRNRAHLRSELGQEPNCCDKYVLRFRRSCTSGDARTSASNTMRGGEASSNDQPPDTVAIRRGPKSSRRNWTKLACGSLLQRHRGRFDADLVARYAQNLELGIDESGVVAGSILGSAATVLGSRSSYRSDDGRPGLPEAGQASGRADNPSGLLPGSWLLPRPTPS